MGKVLLSFALLFLVPLVAEAQSEYPKAEIFGGYSLLRTNPDAMNLHGFNASVAGNVTRWFGVEGDFSGHYGSPNLFGFNLPFLDARSHTFMAGPKLTYHTDTIAPFAHFLIGTSRVSTGAFGASMSDTALATVIGGGVDINVSHWMAIRVIQADCLTTRFKAGPQIFFSGLDERQNNFRLSAGFVLKLGSRDKGRERRFENETRPRPSWR